jgi:hypothetical protein
MTARQHAAVLACLLVAAAFRLPSLERIPGGFGFDEAYNAIDAEAAAHGAWRWFYEANGGREPMSITLQAAAISLLGRDHAVVAMRMVSAAAGIVTVAALYGCAWLLFRNRYTALLSAGLLAASYWHVHFSRYAIRAILAPLWTTLAVAAWWRASSSGHRDARDWLAPAVACGAMLALAAYSHPTGRLVPLLLVGDALLSARPLRKVSIALGTAGAVAFALWSPLAAYFARHPAAFTSHPADVSLAAVAAARYGGSLVAALAANVASVLGMLWLRGDPSTFHNLPGLPVFDPLTGALAAIGIVVLAGTIAGDPALRGDVGAAGRPGAVKPGERSFREPVRAARLVALWMGLLVVPSILSDRAPNFSRAVAALPAIAIVPALGATWLGSALGRRGPRPEVVPVALGALALASATAWTAWHYAVAFPRLPQVYRSFDGDKIDALAALQREMDDRSVYLTPLWARHATIAFLARGSPLAELDPADTLVLRDRRPITLAIPSEQAGTAEGAASLLRGAGSMRWVQDRQGRALLTLIDVEPAAWGDLVAPKDAPLEPAVWSGAVFGSALRLVGLSVGGQATPAPSVRDGRSEGSVELTFVWACDASVTRSYTLFVHILEADGTAAGQLDREPGAGSVPTSNWSPGEVVIDRYRVAVAAGAAGPLRAEIGWYDFATGERLTLPDGATQLRLPLEGS